MNVVFLNEAIRFHSNTQAESKNFIQMQKSMQILRLNDLVKIGNIIVTYQMDHGFLLCEYPVIDTLMLVHKGIRIVCMWLITIIAFDYHTTLLQISRYIS